MDIDPTKTAGFVAAILGIFSTVTAWVRGQSSGRAEFITAVHKASDQVITQLRAEVERKAADHASCEEQLAAHRKETEGRLQAMEEEINRLMKGPVPPYTEFKRPLG